MINREAADRWCERGILALVLAVLVFGPLALGAVRTQDFLVIQGMTLGIMLLWGARLWFNSRPQLLWPPICWAVLAFAIYTGVRYLTADIEYFARQEFIQVLVYAFLFFAILNNLHRQESTQIVTFTLIGLALALSFYAVYQFVTASGHVWLYTVHVARHRGSGTYVSPNHLGGFLEMLLPLALGYTLVGRVKAVSKVLLGYAALVMLAAIAVTVSRGTWVATAVALLLFFGLLSFHRSYRLPALALLVAVVGAGAFFLPRSYFVQTRIKSLVSEKGRVDDDMRLALWEPALGIWHDYPWWGAGPAQFDYHFAQYRLPIVQLRAVHAHNDYVETLADYGLAGAALVAAACGLLGLGVARTWRFVRPSSADLGAKRGSNKFAFVLGASLGLVAILVHSVVDFNMHIPANAILAVALMALLSSHLRFATERYWVRAGLWLKGLVSVCLLAGVGYLGFQGWRHAVEYVRLERANRAPNFSAAKVALLKAAYSADPKNPDTVFGIAWALQIQSQEGGDVYAGQEGVDYRRLATEAMEWFERLMRLNPWDSHGWLGYGWCLDWLGRPTESAPYFARAEEVDPNSFIALNSIGLHYVQLHDYAAAKPWFERSLRLDGRDNPVGRSYLQIANSRMQEAATNEMSARLYYFWPK